MPNETRNALRVLMYCPEDELFHETMNAIERVQENANQRFVWSPDGLNLQPFDLYEFWDHSTHPSWSPEVLDYPAAIAMIPTNGDAWKTHLVIRFLRWVSKKLPAARLRVNDEGYFVRPGGIVIVDGQFLPDWGDARAWKSYFVETEDWTKTLADFEAVVPDSMYPLVAFAPLAKGFANRSEIKALGLSRRELAQLTIDEVADRICLPWDEDTTR
ncbi:MAG: hypothetical protein JNK05_13195 [Myxococcales bacterium]|nr:hypothetical protein [Myxococcales bacterium]